MMNKLPSIKSIFIFLILTTVYYIIFYSYNASKSKINELDSKATIKCISNICIKYDNIKECIHIKTPILFKIETILDINYLNSEVKSIELDAIKEGCK